jgi:hypothetical protein
MAFVHGKNTYISIDGDDLSAYFDTSEIERASDEDDVTTYGRDDHVVAGGLLKGSVSGGGTYDDTSAGPAAVLNPLVGTVVTLIRRPEGTGTGKPQESMSVLIKSVKETNPVAGHIKWSFDGTRSGAITDTTQ